MGENPVLELAKRFIRNCDFSSSMEPPNLNNQQKIFPCVTRGRKRIAIALTPDVRKWDAHTRSAGEKPTGRSFALCAGDTRSLIFQLHKGLEEIKN